LIGAGAGALWGLADNPIYTATASVVIDAPAVELESLPAAPSASTVLALAEGEEVARAAAGLTGDDLSGADLLSVVTPRAGVGADTVELVAASETPDFAAAAADAYAAALVDVVAADWRQSLEAAIAVSSDSSHVQELEEALAVAPTLRVAAAAELPTEPQIDRSAGLWALLGSAAGLILAGLGVGLSGGRSRASAPPLAERRGREETAAEPMPVAAEPMPAAAEPAKPSVAPRSSTGRRPRARVSFAGSSFLRVAGEPVRAAAEDLEQAIALAAELGLSDKGGSICVAGALRGEGRSTVAIALAVASALSGARTLLVEADLRHPVLERRLALAPGPGLIAYLSARAGPADVSRSVQVADSSGATAARLVCVPAGESGEAAARSLHPDRLSGLAERLERVYETVIFDSPAALSYPDAGRVAAAVGRTIACSRAQPAAGVSRRRLGEVLGVELAAFVEVGEIER